MLLVFFSLLFPTALPKVILSDKSVYTCVLSDQSKYACTLSENVP